MKVVVTNGTFTGSLIRPAWTNTFSGIRPVDLPGFILAELCGALAGMLLMNWLLGRSEAQGPVAMAEVRPVAESK